MIRHAIFGISIAVFATGCTQSYTCGCTDFDNGPFYYAIEASSEEAAREACESPGGDCTLQTE